jgi:hypothetical protein
MTSPAGWLAVPATEPDARPDAYLQHLADAGVLDEAEALWDQLDDGEDPCTAATPVQELITDLRARRRR